MSIKYNKDNVKIVTGFSEKLKTDFMNFVDYILNAEDHKRVENYKPERFDINQQRLLSCVYDNNKCVAISTVFESPFYPTGCVRILNRYYILKPYRANSNATEINWIAKQMALQQLDKLSVSYDIDFAFISMEAPKENWLEHWCQTVNITEEFLNYHFKMNEDTLYLICDNPKCKTCWQHICYTQLSDNKRNPFDDNNKISLSTWRKLFHE